MTSESDILRLRCRLSKPYKDSDREEDLTVGIAFRCKDGIVLAADRLRTKKNDIGRFVTKVRAFRYRKNLLGAMVGAGVSRYIDPARDWFDDALEDGMTLDAAQAAIDQACREMYTKYMESDSNSNYDEPHFSFLTALWNRKEGFRLLRGTSDCPASIVDDEYYVVIGKGASLASCLVETFYSSKGVCEECREAALVSAVTLRLVKRFVSGCGGGTDIIGIMEGGLARPRSKFARKEAESEFLDFLRPIRVDMKRFVRLHCQIPLLVRRFPREKKAR